MVEINTLGYAVLRVQDMVSWRRLSHLLGFQQVAGVDRSVLLRMDERKQRIVLEPGAEDDLVALGWELGSEDDLVQFVAGLEGKGVMAVRASDEDAAKRSVRALWKFTGPDGIIHELYFGAQKAETPFRSENLLGGGYVTGDLGFGHVLLRADDLPSSIHFYRETLGLRLSDRVIEHVAPDVTVDATFFHAKTGRHHSLAVANMPGKRRLGHFMVEARSMDDVGMAYERCIQADIPIRAVLGRHPNDQMFSFYIDTPSGFAVEFGAGGLVVGEDWQVKTHDRLSEWGHRRERKAFPASPSRASLDNK